MSILTVKDMSHGFGDKVIFENVSFRLLRGEHIGLIGANGTGKSTFMNLITSRLLPDEGQIIWSNGVRVGYMDQHVILEKGFTIEDVLKGAFKHLFDAEAKMNELFNKMGEVSPEDLERMLNRTAKIQEMLNQGDFYSIDSRIEDVARGLGLLELGLDRDVTDLSGGQRTKVLLAKLLLECPDILLLDEPTNHLDEDHIQWFKKYLQNYKNAFILITHEVSFLNDVTNIIYHVENRRLTRYVGNYYDFKKTYAARREQLLQAYNKQQVEISKLEDYVARNRYNAATARMAQSRIKRLNKMDIIKIDKKAPTPIFDFKEAQTSGKMIFETKDLVIGYDAPLTRPLNLSMERGQKIALIGANGLGKTTLLKSLMGIIPSVSGDITLGDLQCIGYFEQESNEDNDKTCLEEFWSEFPGLTQRQVRSALARCGLTKEHIESKVKVLSGGEAAKVRLAKLINKESNILILDEPTNHLDVEAKNQLRKALINYKGTILLVCHEPEFYRDVVTEVWNCEDWTLKIT